MFLKDRYTENDPAMGLILEVIKMLRAMHH